MFGLFDYWFQVRIHGFRIQGSGLRKRAINHSVLTRQLILCYLRSKKNHNSEGTPPWTSKLSGVSVCIVWWSGDRWHVTGGGRRTFSQNVSSLALTAWEWRFVEDWVEKAFLVFKQLSGQSFTLFLFPIVDKIQQTMLVVTTAAVKHFRTWWLNLLWAVSECLTVIVSFQIDSFEL